jgi:hypothetical protein
MKYDDGKAMQELYGFDEKSLNFFCEDLKNKDFCIALVRNLFSIEDYVRIYKADINKFNSLINPEVIKLVAHSSPNPNKDRFRWFELEGLYSKRDYSLEFKHLEKLYDERLYKFKKIFPLVKTDYYDREHTSGYIYSNHVYKELCRLREVVPFIDSIRLYAINTQDGKTALDDVYEMAMASWNDMTFNSKVIREKVESYLPTPKPSLESLGFLEPTAVVDARWKTPSPVDTTKGNAR